MLRINAKDIGHREAFTKMLMAPLKPIHLELEHQDEHEFAKKTMKKNRGVISHPFVKNVSLCDNKRSTFTTPEGYIYNLRAYGRLKL